MLFHEGLEKVRANNYKFLFSILDEPKFHLDMYPWNFANSKWTYPATNSCNTTKNKMQSNNLPYMWRWLTSIADLKADQVVEPVDQKDLQ